MKLAKGSKIIMVPYPAQGHVTPMLKLPVMVTPAYIHRQVMFGSRAEHIPDKVSWIPLSDGTNNDNNETKQQRDFFAIEASMENDMPGQLEQVIGKLKVEVEDENCGRLVCLVVDLLASWAIDVGRRCGVHVAGFWPAMFATYRFITAIPEMIKNGLISADTARFLFWTKTFNRSTTLQWLLVNSFPEEYINIDNCHHKQQEVEDHSYVFPIGPLSNHSKTKNLSLWEEDNSCLEWPDKQNPNSVIYISFGSWVSPIGEEKVKDLAVAIEAFGKPFIWVLGSSGREGLLLKILILRIPKKVSKQGKMVSWAPQMEILEHRALGCYLTHCGWNSTMEAIRCRKRLLCYPINGFGQIDIEEGLKKVKEEDNEMSKRLEKLHEKTWGKRLFREVSLISIPFLIGSRNLTFKPFL
ncbi:hypothetical protein UlMin_014062 [Ulmus minor]